MGLGEEIARRRESRARWAGLARMTWMRKRGMGKRRCRMTI